LDGGVIAVAFVFGDRSIGAGCLIGWGVAKGQQNHKGPSLSPDFFYVAQIFSITGRARACNALAALMFPFK
jgi:hypothetical protein